MGTYNSAVITNGGQSMIAQAVAGASLEFTTIKTSSYAYPAGTNLATLTTINGIKQSKDITGAAVYNSRVIKISAAVDNTGISTAYTINTIGIYAKVGSGAESLFAVVTASAADTMPADDSKPYSYIYEINLTMQNAANVTVTVNAAGLVNVADLNAAKVEIQGEIADLKSALNNINGSQIKTKQIDYSILTISENKKITEYDTSTFLPVLANESGSVVADFAIADVAMYDLLKIPRCSKSIQWVILYGASKAINFSKRSTITGILVDLSNTDYGILKCQRLREQSNYSRVAIAFDAIVDLTVESQFSSFFELMDSVKENKNAVKDIRNLNYSNIINISTASSNVFVPFYIYEGEKLRFINNTSGNTALYAIDANGQQTTIATGLGSDRSIIFEADKDYVQLKYWSQQTGTVDVERINSVIYEMTESLESEVIASVNMFESIGAIGDSYTAGSTRNSAGTWKDYRNLSWIATMGKRSGTTWKNYGHGGATTQSYLSTTEFATALSDTACDIYFFALGQNDGNQSLTIGTVADIHDSDYTQNADTFYGNYGRIIQQIKNHAPNAKLVIVKNWVRGATWTDYDTAIEGIATHYGIPCIDPFDDYFFNSALYQNYKEYGHPTAMGYSSMGIAMERLFSKCVANNPSYFKFATIG